MRMIMAKKRRGKTILAREQLAENSEKREQYARDKEKAERMRMRREDNLMMMISCSRYLGLGRGDPRVHWNADYLE